MRKTLSVFIGISFLCAAGLFVALKLLDSKPINENKVTGERSIANDNADQADNPISLGEVNAPRGEFLGFSGTLLSIKDSAGQTILFDVTPGQVQFSCVTDFVSTKENGERVSFYDSYINIAGFSLALATPLIQSEVFLDQEKIPEYEALDSNPRVIYVLNTSEGVTEAGLMAKVIFLLCR